MTSKVLVLVGTKKGAFVLECDASRRSFALRGPYCDNWPMNHVIADCVYNPRAVKKFQALAPSAP